MYFIDKKYQFFFCNKTKKSYLVGCVEPPDIYDNSVTQAAYNRLSFRINAAEYVQAIATIPAPTKNGLHDTDDVGGTTG